MHEAMIIPIRLVLRNHMLIHETIRLCVPTSFALVAISLCELWAGCYSCGKLIGNRLCGFATTLGETFEATRAYSTKNTRAGGRSTYRCYFEKLKSKRSKTKSIRRIKQSQSLLQRRRRGTIMTCILYFNAFVPFAPLLLVNMRRRSATDAP